ncbi:two-component system, OmpR family, sensor histidine kinase (plasmid) [Azospirillum sp. B510]|uniref:sensor histidine kinase n=1 Tax=Azospirillum sp. (strain B510) TaxID=137722 RepID=UPI0001C4CD0E|nr:sensor histidine kinase KdpD [Azospirillum sp. B510]BAI74933.1 two-component system, OmpR family, sensor histidine kinase [Azospirillum sp. B510]
MAEPDSDERPSPDALLEEANRERRGRLKIFLGAAPGVGKTYAMLEDAHARRRDGTDLVVGVVETHGRHDTEALLDGLDILPRRRIDYRGRPFQEMDLDAILARRPRLVLVDELAHTNIPGSRHLKRWQDVEEILDAGIDVCSTLNVQHLESLNDVVERIAGIKVRETLPDSVLHRADEIALIDLPPQELIRRLQEGKVYVPEQAKRAADHFFSAGTLTALREMALRQAAERVDAQMLRYMRAHAIAGPWPTRERILVCIGDGPQALRLVRTAKRAAERRDAPWVVLYVDTHRNHALSEEDKDGIAQALRLAAQLGGETAVVPGERAAAEILAFARARNVSQIIVGRAHPRRRLRALHQSVTTDLLARNEDFDVLVVAGEDERPARSLETRAPSVVFDWLAYVVATLTVASATAIGLAIDVWLPLPNISVAYLVGVLLVAIRHGLAPSIYASVLSFLTFNFLFTEPKYTFAITDAQNIMTVFFFLVAAVITSNLAARVRAQVETTRLSARRTANLYDFNRRISAAVGLDDVLWAVVHHVASTMNGHSLVLLPREGRLEVAAGYPPEDTLDEKSMAAARWSWENGKTAGRGSTTLPAADWLFLPLRTGRGPMGVLGVQMTGEQQLLSPEQGRLLDTLADQAAVAIERTALVADIETARVAAETERLRSALLSSLSHDLRTPLVSILGASSSLTSYGETLAPPERMELVQTIQEEAERLNRFVQNLLDMTRIGSGALKPRTDWVDLADVIGAALERAKRMLGDRPVRLELEPGLPLLRLDPVLTGQVFFNLIDNACKYSPDGSPILLQASRAGGEVLIELCDQGAGIPEADRERIFDMFYRVEAGDAQTAGTGLGLAICRGIVEAHGGTIRALPGRHGVGTCIAILLPVPAGPEIADIEGDSARGEDSGTPDSGR